MNTARRWYIYLVCAISLQGLTWAVIALLRNILAGGGGGITAIAFQIASIIITLPLFLVHWLWAQRLASRDMNEREAGLRGIYHYAMMAGFLGPVIANLYSLVSYVFFLAVGRSRFDPLNGFVVSPLQGFLYNLLAIIVCAILWFYQSRVIADDVKASRESEGFASMRRLYIFFFSAWGMTMISLAVIHIIRWIMFQLWRSSGTITYAGDMAYLTDEISRLIVGVPLWLIFWRRAQQLFMGNDEQERNSALRKFYLYTTVFVASLTAVTNATGILAGLFRRVLSLPPEGDIRVPLPIIIVMGLLWMYHASVLKEDASVAAESARQGGVRRLYLYLIAGVGLAAFLVGFSGDLSVLIRAFSQSFGASLKEALAWFTAALIAGLPVWLLPWRRAQIEAVSLSSDGMEARRSTARKIYLYFYLFVATMTVLSGAIYVLYRLLSLLLGDPGDGDLLSEIAQAIAYALVGVGVWLYHGYALRGDGASSRRELAMRLKDIKVAIVDTGAAGFGQTLFDRLRQEEPDLNLELINHATQEDEVRQAIPAKLGEAGVIIGPWSIAVDGSGLSTEITRAVVNSKARKILIPLHMEGWDLAGVDDWSVDGLMQQTVRAVKQWAGGEEIKAVRPMGVGGIILSAFGILFLLLLLVIPLLVFFAGGF